MSAAPWKQDESHECRTDSVLAANAVRETSAPETSTAGEGPIIFFDGVCALCDQAIKRVVAADKKGVFRYAPLQGETARRRLQPLTPEQKRDAQNGAEDEASGGGWLRSMVLLDATGEYRNSSAAVRILWYLGGTWSLLGGLLWIVPRPIRDGVYRMIARNRYRWFGKRESCRLPTPAERTRFLD